MWNVADHTWAKHFEGRIITAIAFSSDNKRLAATDFLDKTIEVHDIDSGRTVWSIPKAQQRASSLVFSPGGRSVATSGLDDIIRLLDAATGRESYSLIGHAGSVNSAAFTSDGHSLASASDDGSIRLWDPSKGKAATVLTSMMNSTDWAVVMPDGSTDATQKLVAWCVGLHLDPADRFFASNYTPALLKRLVDGQRLAPGVMLDAATLPPTVEIHLPQSTAGFEAGHISVSVSARK